MKHKFRLIIIFLIQFFCYLLHAQITRYVPSQYSTITAAVNAATSGDTIDILGTFTEPQISINKNLIIRGHDTTNTVVIGTLGGTVFYVMPGTTVRIKNLKIEKGSSWGIRAVFATLIISGCNITNFETGVYISSTNLTITGSDINYNYGTGILFENLTSLTSNISYSNICHNGDGGLLNISGNLNINFCNISYNSKTIGGIINGAGINTRGQCTMKINNCIISHNTITVSSNWGCGGGISNGYGAGNSGISTLIINNSTISNNSVVNDAFGGGIYNDLKGILLINNSTISDNSISGSIYLYGGGVCNYGVAKINNSTIAGNKISNTGSSINSLGAGLYSSNFNGGTLIKNTILGNNIIIGNSNSIIMDYSGLIISYGYNLVSQSPAPEFNITGDQSGGNPMIDPLNNNGGFTKTQALKFGSPAIDAGSNTDIDNNPVLYDQRNYPRCNVNDIGAFEKNTCPNKVVQITDNICILRQNLPIIQICLFVFTPATVKSFTFNTTGTTNTSEILIARLFATGNSNLFSTTKQFGSQVNSPSGNFLINDSMELQPGYNYFWLTYDITTSAIHGNLFDAGCTDIIIDSTHIIPDNSSPPGSRHIPVVKANFRINDSTQCLIQNAFLFTNLSTTSSGTLTNSWDFGDGSFSASVSPSHHYSFFDTLAVRLITEAGTGCSDTTIKKVYVFPEPVAKFNINDSGQCLNTNNFIFTDNSSVLWGSVDSLIWDFGDNSGSLLKNPSHTYLTFDTFTVNLIAVSSGGCRDTFTGQVTVYPVPIADFKMNDSAQCLSGNKFIYNNLCHITPSGNLTYQWDFDDGQSDILKDPVHSYAKDGIYYIKLTAISDLTCRDTVIKSLTVWPLPGVAFTINDSSQCFNENQFIFKNNLQSIITMRQWTFGDGITDTQAVANHKYLSTGSFPVKLVATTDNHCIDSIIKMIIVLPSPSPDFNVNDSSQCFKNNLFNFINKSDAYSHTFEWSFGDGVTDTSYSPAHSFNLPGKFDVTLKAFTTDLCMDSVIKIVEVRPNPVNPVVGSNSPVCKGEAVNLHAVSTPNSSYHWTADNGYTSDLQNPLIKNTSFRDSGNYYVKANLNDCQSDSSSVRIIINPLPSVNLGKDNTICEGDKVYLDPGYFYSYIWQDNSTSRIFNVTEPGLYRVVVTNSFGCKNYDEITFKEKCPPRIFIPDAFTPNRDGLNDKFEIITSDLMHFEIRIFDHWGENIFHSTDASISWDGTYKGTDCQIGTYTYMIYTTDNDAIIRNFQGIVTLFR